jgi:hypothetical protein
VYFRHIVLIVLSPFQNQSSAAVAPHERRFKSTDRAFRQRRSAITVPPMLSKTVDRLAINLRAWLPAAAGADQDRPGASRAKWPRESRFPGTAARRGRSLARLLRYIAGRKSDIVNKWKTRLDLGPLQSTPK